MDELVSIGARPPVGGVSRLPRPDWLRIRLSTPEPYHRVRRLMEGLNLSPFE